MHSDNDQIIKIRHEIDKIDTDIIHLLAQEKNLDLNFLKRIWKEILMESYRIQLQSAADE
jgi:chorismate mutase